MTPGLLLALTPELPLALAPGLPLGLTLGLPLGPQPCNPFALVASPKLGLRQEALHLIVEEVNYEKFMASKDKDFRFNMGKF